MVLIVGSGVGGSMVALELAKSNIPVTIIEKGPFAKVKDSANYYNDETNENIDLLKTTIVGGSSVVAAGNGVRILEDEMAKIGIDISKELDEIEELLAIHQLNDSHIGNGTRKFIESAKSLGLNVMKMPKFIREEDCLKCGKCAWGCPYDAKWSAQDFIKQAIELGANLMDNAEVIEIITQDNKVKGLKIKTKNGEEIIDDETIVLAAGAIDSAILLQKLGLKAGEKLFVDPFVTIGGVIRDIGYNSEVSMNALHIGRNFVLAPHYSMFITQNAGENVNPGDILGIMVKIPDDTLGRIVNGKVIKKNTTKDIRFIAEGAATAGAILTAAGVDPTTITSTHLRAAHPGGTAAIGDVVDTNLKTEIDGLYVGDASVIPKAPGAPPIIAILALAKRLGKHLVKELS
ncbi:MAG: FAD-dependent oxidoreductase [Methanobrevibacter sp.]|jgi:choline dehydrogenase-like flavoprotein|nr:FAD-dependent oxidoreductase [Candidatus Methanoflexus mossambicus]